MGNSETTDSSRPVRWGVVGGWVLLTASLTLGFAHNFREMWDRWFPAWRYTRQSLYERVTGGESYYTHGPLVPLVSLVIALLLVRHTKIPVRARLALGLPVLVLSLLVHLASSLARVNFVSGFSFIGVMAGLVLVLWGTAALRRLWFPLAFLAFMVPLPEVSIYQLNFRLKMWSAEWGVALANVLGIVAERSGNRVFLESDKSLVIANVCNGLRTLISLLAFGALYAYVCRLRGAWRLVLFGFSVPVAVVSNSLRVVSLIAVADIWNTRIASGWYHDLSGVLIYPVAFMLMFGLERVILWGLKAVGRPVRQVALFSGQLRDESDRGQGSRMWQAAGAAGSWLAGGLVLLAGAESLRLNRTVPPPCTGQQLAQALPRTVQVDGQQWAGGIDEALDDKTLTILEHPEHVLRDYRCAERAVSLLVLFSRDNRKGIHPPDQCLEGGGGDIIGKADVDVGDVPGLGNLPCRELLVQTGGRKQYFLYTYKCGGRYTRSFWVQQGAIFLNSLLDRHAGGALVRVSTAADGDLSESRRTAMRFLASMVEHLDSAMP